jgi:hypothetical protein
MISLGVCGGLRWLTVFILREEWKPRSPFDRGVDAVERMVRGRRKSASFVRDAWTEWLKNPEAKGATAEELDDDFRSGVEIEEVGDEVSAHLDHDGIKFGGQPPRQPTLS